MTYYDWSCKKDTLIKNFDGTLLPMSEPYFSARQIAPDTWRILSSGDYSYLLAGDGQGLLIDSGYGAGNIRAFCENLCGMPVPWIANTHAHFDHTANNGYFDLVYISETDYPNATIPFASFHGVEFRKDYPVQFIKSLDVIPLPGRELLCFDLGDHSPGSMAFLDKKTGILFSGDEIWTSKPLRGAPAAFAAKLEVIAWYRQDFDILYAGNGEYGAGVLDKLLRCCQRAMAGDPGEKPPQDLGLLGFWGDTLEDGTVVFDRIRPHKGDGGIGKADSGQDKRRCITQGNVRLIFQAE